MLLYVLDTYNYDRGAFCNCTVSRSPKTAEDALRKGEVPKIRRVGNVVSGLTINSRKTVIKIKI